MNVNEEHIPSDSDGDVRVFIRRGVLLSSAYGQNIYPMSLEGDIVSISDESECNSENSKLARNEGSSSEKKVSEEGCSSEKMLSDTVDVSLNYNERQIKKRADYKKIKRQGKE